MTLYRTRGIIEITKEKGTPNGARENTMKRTNNGFWITWDCGNGFRIYHETFGGFKFYNVQKAEPNRWGGTTWTTIAGKVTLREAKAEAARIIAEN